MSTKLGPLARVWWQILFRPGATYQDLHKALKIQKGWSYLSYTTGGPYIGYYHTGSNLGGILTDLLEHGYARRVKGIGPRGGFGYFVTKKLPKQIGG